MHQFNCVVVRCQLRLVHFLVVAQQSGLVLKLTNLDLACFRPFRKKILKLWGTVSLLLSIPARPPKVIQKAIFNNIQSESCDEVEIAALLVPLPNFIQNHQKGAKQKQRDVGCFIFFLTALRGQHHWNQPV